MLKFHNIKLYQIVLMLTDINKFNIKNCYYFIFSI